MTFDEYKYVLNEAYTIRKESTIGCRYGQSIYIALSRIAPDLALSILGTPRDIFYLDENIENFKNSLMIGDINGDALNVGQKVVCSDSYGNLTVRIIKKFTDKSVILEPDSWYIALDKAPYRIMILR